MQSDLPLLQASVVNADEIDSLGHMNVRFYVARTVSAKQQLLGELGLLTPGHRLRRLDTYTRFRREQFAGAKLGTYGGLLLGERIDGQPGISGYFEVRNTATGEVAASFIVTSEIRDEEDQRVPGTRFADQLSPLQGVTVPKQGMPRSLDLTPPRPVAMAHLLERVPETTVAGMMSGIRRGTVQTQDCDSSGLLRDEVDLMHVVFRLSATADEADTPAMGPPVMQDELGRRYSWAMMETRSVSFNQAHLGDDVISIGADIAVGENWRHSRRWMYVERTGLLLGISDSLGLCIDLDARRSIPVPQDIRASLAATCFPDLA